MTSGIDSATSDVVGRRAEHDADPLAPDEAVARAALPAVHQRPSVADEPLRVRAADAGHGGDGEIDAAGRRDALDRAIRHRHAAGSSWRRRPSARR